jgi:hypothetical protein
MDKKTEPRNMFWKVRLNEADKLTRQAVAEYLHETESEIDRRLWEQEYKRISDDISERIENGRVDNPVPDILSGECNPVLPHNGRLRLYTIPMWDEKGNAQVFIEKPSGEWLDVQRECMVTKDYVIKYVAGYERAILSYL